MPISPHSSSGGLPPRGGLMPRTESTTYWQAHLYIADANPDIDDPVWSCSHSHLNTMDAEVCALTEISHRSYRSKYAKDKGVAATPDVAEILAVLDSSFVYVETSLTDPHVIRGVCDRLFQAYTTGQVNCGLPHESEGA